MTSKLRAGIIGCGLISRNHVKGYMNSDRYELVGIADLSTTAMEQYDEMFKDFDYYQPTHYTDARELLDKESLDVVSVGTWHVGHSTWTIAAAARQPKAILCEKPMAVNTGVAAQMLMVCQRNRVKLAISHQRRFLPSYTTTRKLISEGVIGNVELITSVSGSGLPNDASHHMDMYRYILGDLDCDWVMGQVERNTDRHERNTRIEDRAQAVFGFEGGVRAHIVSDLTPKFTQGCMIYGSDGMIEMRTTHLKLMNKDTKGEWEKLAPNGQFFKVNVPSFEVLEGYTAQAKDLADWAEDKTDSFRGEATHGYKALEMIHAIYESARLHERVGVPLKTRSNPLDLLVESGLLPVRYPGYYDIRANLLRGENLLTDEDNL